MQETIELIKEFMDENPDTNWEALKAALPYSHHQSMLSATRHLHKTGYLVREAVRIDGHPDVLLKKV